MSKGSKRRKARESWALHRAMVEIDFHGLAIVAMRAAQERNRKWNAQFRGGGA